MEKKQAKRYPKEYRLYRGLRTAARECVVALADPTSAQSDDLSVFDYLLFLSSDGL